MELFIKESRTVRRALLLIAAALGVATSACDETFISIDSSGLIELRFGDVRWEAEVVTVNNAGADTVFHFLVEGETAAVIDWIPCYDADSTRCPQIFPGDTAELPYFEIAGYQPGDSLAYFFWWTRSERTVHSEEMRLR